MDDRSEKIRAELERLLRQVGCGPGAGAVVMEGDAAGRALPADRSLALLYFDPLGIQDLVLSSRRLVSIRGASKLLVRWDGQQDQYLEESGWITLFAGEARRCCSVRWSRRPRRSAS